MRFRRERGIAACGLACVVCSVEECSGCRSSEAAKDCKILKCAEKRDIEGCHECQDFPCGMEYHAGIRCNAFLRFARDHGTRRLTEVLLKNEIEGIHYHYPGEHKGAYDAADSEEEIYDLLLYGKCLNPYEKCPVIETGYFTLRLVREEDADDLLGCYSDAAAQKIFNSDNCIQDFCISSKEEMVELIAYWRERYEQKDFVRFSIMDQKTDRAVGTLEMFGHRGSRGVLRIDIHSDYEQEIYIKDLFDNSIPHFKKLFPADYFIIKASSDAVCRRNILCERNAAVCEEGNYTDYFRL